MDYLVIQDAFYKGKWFTTGEHVKFDNNAPFFLKPLIKIEQQESVSELLELDEKPKVKRKK